MARDDAGDRRLARHRAADAHLDAPAGAEPAPPRRVVDLDADGPPAEEVALLPGPGEVLQRGASACAREDPDEGLALGVVPPLIDVEEEGPGRAGLVVVVAAGDDGAEARSLCIDMWEQYTDQSLKCIIPLRVWIVCEIEQH